MKKSVLTHACLVLITGLSLHTRAVAGGDGAEQQAAHPEGQHDHGGASPGKAGDPGKVTRTVTVDMNDTMRFNPASIAVSQGEVVRFVVKNSGRLKHEMVIGSAGALQEHAKLMRKLPEMEHAEPNQITLQPGKTGAIIWQFTDAGNVDFACLQPGHFEAGMKGVVVVAKK